MSSLGRRFREGTDDAVVARVAHFASWLEGVPSLRYLLGDSHVHDFFAVLQHYGVPTHYVDFTTEPDIAGFFAVHDRSISQGERGCIIAINPGSFVADLNVVAEAIDLPRDKRPEAVTVSVAGLWRMQAQSGYFLYLPLVDAENWCDYDRILFTHDSMPYPIPVERIYPTRKSVLEERLDEFFTEESRDSARADLLSFLPQMMEQLKQRGVPVSMSSTRRSEPKMYLQPDATPHISWSDLDSAWFLPPEETFATAAANAPEVRLFVSAKACSGVEAAVQDAIQSLMISDPQCRSNAVRWSIIGENGIDRRLSAQVERVWDGMRRLPYTTEHMIAAVSRTITMNSGGDRDQNDHFKIELSSRREVTCSVKVSPAQIKNAYREDIAKILRDPSLADRPTLLLQAVWDPTIIFDFWGLVRLFASEIISAQVLHYRHDEAVFFSPATVPVLGLA
jgi:hypothetical protein